MKRTYSAQWYDSVIQRYTDIALEILRGEYNEPDADGAFVPVEMSDEAIADEIHQWLNAPDSLLMTWDGEDADNRLAAAFLDYSGYSGRIVVADGDLGWPYTAAHVLVAVVMERIGRSYTLPPDLSPRPSVGVRGVGGDTNA